MRFSILLKYLSILKIFGVVAVILWPHFLLLLGQNFASGGQIKILNWCQNYRYQIS
jgi:hypothetical protein